MPTTKKTPALALVTPEVTPEATTDTEAKTPSPALRRAYGSRAIQELQAQGWSLVSSDYDGQHSATELRAGRTRLTIRWEKADGRWRLPVLRLTTAPGGEPVVLLSKAEFVLRRTPAAEAIKQLSTAVAKAEA